MGNLVNIRKNLEMDLERVKSSRNESDQQRMRELENRILVLSKDIENTRDVIQEKNRLVEEKNLRIRQLAEQNKSSSNSYSLFQERFQKMEGES